MQSTQYVVEQLYFIWLRLAHIPYKHTDVIVEQKYDKLSKAAGNIGIFLDYFNLWYTPQPSARLVRGISHNTKEKNTI